MPEWKVATPIDTFENPGSGSVIDIVSTVHIGKPSYYRELGRHIMARQDDGFVVHYEDVVSNGQDSVESRGVLRHIKDKLYLATQEANVDIFGFILGYSDYELQDNNAMFYPDGSFNCDVTEQEHLVKLGLFAHGVRFAGAKYMHQKMSNAAQSKSPNDFEECVFDVIRSNVLAYKGPDKKSRRAPGDMAVIDTRNNIALGGVDEALENDAAAKLVLVWGLGHYAGLKAGLVNRGYDHVDRKEVDAAFSMTILERDIRKGQKTIDRKNNRVARRAKLVSGVQDRFVRPSAAKSPSTGIYPASQEFMKQFKKDEEARKKAMQRSMDESRLRTQQLLNSLGDDRRAREK